VVNPKDQVYAVDGNHGQYAVQLIDLASWSFVLPPTLEPTLTDVSISSNE
jgi:hypothetical protein